MIKLEGEARAGIKSLSLLGEKVTFT